MSDLIKNLRDLAALAHADVSVADEAADKIESLSTEIARLREALLLLADNVEHAFPALAGLGPLKKARAALAEEEPSA
jgi:hypothetical protein